MNDEDRQIVWWQLLAGSAITIGATLVAISFAFSITAETGTDLLDAQRSFLRGYFFYYLAIGAFMILAGLYAGWMKILRRGIEKKA